MVGQLPCERLVKPFGQQEGCGKDILPPLVHQFQRQPRRTLHPVHDDVREPCLDQLPFQLGAVVEVACREAL